MNAAAKDLGFDELFDMGDIDLLLEKTKEKCEQKLRGQRFAGMEKDDVVQEVLIRVHRSLDRYDSEKAKVSTYVEHVMDNMIKDCFRKAGSIKNLMVVNSADILHEYSADNNANTNGVQLGDVDAGFTLVDLEQDISIHLNLNSRERQIFRLRTQGYEFVEIAEMLGVTKSRISQIWKKILIKYNSY